MPAPVARPGRQVGVQGGEPGVLIVGHRAAGHDQEVAVAGQVRGPQREGPLQVGAHERGAEDPAPLGDQVTEDGVSSSYCVGSGTVTPLGGQISGSRFWLRGRCS